MSAFATLLLAAMPAQAQRQPSFFPLWSIDPIAGFADKAVEKGGQIAEAKMLPATLYVLDEDYRQDKGNMGAPKGTELVGLKTEGMGACAIYAPDLKGIASIASWGTDRHFCVLDRDNDGVFDRYFHRQDSQGGFFNMFSTWPKELKVGHGGRFHQADPRSFSRPMTWKLSFDRCNIAKGWCRVSTGLSIPGWGGRSAGVFTVLYGRQDQLTLIDGAADWKVLGATIRVRAVSDTSAIFTLAENFPGEPFPLL